MLFGGGGATRYALPYRPVKPLLIIEDVGMRSARHLKQRRWDVGCVARKDVGCGGEDEGEAVEVVEVETEELLRLQKGLLGRR